ncbi:hypothetical protein OUZ56_019417 [Daphnia magna]|uniref:Uncharacterized protein n=1 Tax=Daphnia magna TaxID=35525 RepID=A0ABQ9ZCK2_9CRUS|nr:hypothetical protein OUZ56_019417 [Daphnia magna]
MERILKKGQRKLEAISYYQSITRLYNTARPSFQRTWEEINAAIEIIGASFSHLSLVPEPPSPEGKSFCAAGNAFTTSVSSIAAPLWLMCLDQKQWAFLLVRWMHGTPVSGMEKGIRIGDST